MRLVFDIEEWRDVVGAEDRYQVSNFGKVKSKSYVKHGRNIHGPFSFTTKSAAMSTPLNAYGYPAINLRLSNGEDRPVAVHRLVAEAFIPNPNALPQVNHKDSDRANNCVSNLEWVSAQDNVKHGFESGFHTTAGEDHPRSVLNDEVVRRIRSMKAEGWRVTDIARSLNLKYHTVHKVAKGLNWSHVV